MFWRVLVYDLSKHHAETTASLKDHLAYNGIRFPEDEVVALVESARLAGLVEPLGHSMRADGTEITEAEWRPTPKGEKLPPPIDEETVKADAFSWGAVRRLVSGRVFPGVKLIGLTTIATVIGSVLALSAGGIVAWILVLFGAVLLLAVLVAPLRVRLTDWLVLQGWPSYGERRASRRRQLDALRETRRPRSLLRRNHLSYWQYIRARATMINRDPF